MIFTLLGLCMSTLAPAGLVIWMAFYVRHRVEAITRVYLEEVERLNEVIARLSARHDVPAVKVEDGLNGTAVVLVETPAPLPVARVHVR